jgi:mannose-6-phosphate isomerase-like protein (cupin superfamily)
MKKHEDNRRVLIEWVEDSPMRSCKVVIAKGETVVGEHYHKNKDEIFYLLIGRGEYNLGGNWFPFGDPLFIPRGTWHSFRLSDGAILLGAASEPFDINDEIK